jgi:RNA-directed DNA polymerase
MTATQTSQPYEEDIFSTQNRKKCKKYVFSMQRQLDKAVAKGEKGKIRYISYLLTRVSKAAKIISTQRITDNSGCHTAGIDGVSIPKGIGTETKNRKKVELMKQIDTKKKPSAIRRTYIPKPNGKLRPLGIPTLLDRIIQDVIKTAIEPIVEYHFSHHSWGFRPKRGCADARDHIFKKMSRKNCPQWVLEGDIKGCFDNIRHTAITEQLKEWCVPKQQVRVINRMLKANIIDEDTSQYSKKGTPQGWVVSPMLANVAMHRLDNFCETVIRKRFKMQTNPIVRYADDFVVICKTKEQAEGIKGRITDFIKKTIGLELSEEKTKITHISEGFDFLSFNFRKNNGGPMIIKPSKESVLTHSNEMKLTKKQYKGSNLSTMLRKLNSQIRGWSNYYRGTVKTETFSKLDNELWHGIWRWLRRLHPNKKAGWIRKKYSRFTSKQNRFTEHGIINVIHNDIKWTPHVMVKGGMRVYDKEALGYWEKREQKLAKDQMYSKRMERLWKRQKGLCSTCEEALTATDIGKSKVHTHHCLPRSQGGDDSLNNLERLHEECHRKIHTLYTRKQMAYWVKNLLKYWCFKAVKERERELTV